jgi:hypothetical protein
MNFIVTESVAIALIIISIIQLKQCLKEAGMNFKFLSKLIAFGRSFADSPKAKLVETVIENELTSPAVLTEVQNILRQLEAHAECGPVFTLAIDGLQHLITNPQ